MPKTLSRRFFNRPTLVVARSLIGKYLVRENGHGTVAGRIVEVEAYVGSQDMACHASKGRTARTEVLFGPPGISYVYLIYGMYHMLNVVTERTEFPAAVLIRAIEVDGELIDGPGKLCRVLEIDRSLNRLDLTHEGFRKAGRHISEDRRGLCRSVGEKTLAVPFAGPRGVSRSQRIWIIKADKKGKPLFRDFPFATCRTPTNRFYDRR
jgi:DNA-3-methyladenine glycosylase